MQMRYRAGLTNYLAVLSTEDDLIARRRTMADLRRAWHSHRGSRLQVPQPRHGRRAPRALEAV